MQALEFQKVVTAQPTWINPSVIFFSPILIDLRGKILNDTLTMRVDTNVPIAAKSPILKFSETFAPKDCHLNVDIGNGISIDLQFKDGEMYADNPVSGTAHGYIGFKEG
mgnify:CR=1 FL=1